MQIGRKIERRNVDIKKDRKKRNVDRKKSRRNVVRKKDRKKEMQIGRKIEKKKYSQEKIITLARQTGRQVEVDRQIGRGRQVNRCFRKQTDRKSA